MDASDRFDRDGLYRRWRWRRCAERARRVALACWFVLIAFFAGPNLMLFGKLTWITPADFAPIAERDVAPIVRMIKAYAATYGQMPDADAFNDLMLPVYRRPYPREVRFAVLRDDAMRCECESFRGNQIVYRFNPPNEGWSVAGLFANGPIPLPAVEPAPLTAVPAARLPAPASRRSTSRPARRGK